MKIKRRKVNVEKRRLWMTLKKFSMTKKFKDGADLRDYNDGDDLRDVDDGDDLTNGDSDYVKVKTRWNQEPKLNLKLLTQKKMLKRALILKNLMKRVKRIL